MTQKIFALVLFLIFAAGNTVAGCQGKEDTGISRNHPRGKKAYVTGAYKKYFGAPKPAYPNTTYYVVFYSYSDREPYFAGKVRPIAKETDAQKNLPLLAVSKLFQEPPINQTTLTQLISAETELIDLKVKNKTATVNFSKEILNSQVGASDDQSIIASLTQTLCQFDTIQKVKIKIEGKSKGLIDGHSIEGFLGHISLLAQPFKPEDELVVTQDQEDAITTVQSFVQDIKNNEMYKYLSKETIKDVGSEEEFKKEEKSDLHKVIISDHGYWVSLSVTDAKFKKNKAEVVAVGNRTVNGEYRENDKVLFALQKERSQWKIDFTETSETIPSSGHREDISTGPANLNREQMQQIQAFVDQGQQSWRLDPLAVAQIEGAIFGFDKNNDAFSLISKIDMGQLSGTGEAVVEIVHKGITYRMFLMQPVKSGTQGIWAINTVSKK